MKSCKCSNVLYIYIFVIDHWSSFKCFSCKEMWCLFIWNFATVWSLFTHLFTDFVCLLCLFSSNFFITFSLQICKQIGQISKYTDRTIRWWTFIVSRLWEYQIPETRLKLLAGGTTDQRVEYRFLVLSSATDRQQAAADFRGGEDKLAWCTEWNTAYAFS